ncbi:polysaccharide biosynthesis tyrosine autokinase [Pseudooceanicola sp.]|uniref:GumC family protein n=1 Tax=Pseudooceanicola sp. TaxID=1914328 RepID=UPI00262BAAA7|nr:polysaccharide biosynthesis tyrosine autokinase [Pseudooceanicola sp.]MDF1856189.1 polysaccharide biosynthesis tyrosine autokinase [Pseudooceanicola sp.]
MTDIFDRGPLAPRRRSAATQDGDSVDLRMMFRGVWNDRFIILGAALACGILAAFLVLQVTPRYTSVSQILLDPRERQVITNQQVVSDLKLSDQVVASELSIMRSNLLLEKVIEEIDAIDPKALEILDPAEKSPRFIDSVTSSMLGLFRRSKSDGAGSAEMAERARLERLTWAIRRSVTLSRDGKAYVITIKAETEDPGFSALLAATIAEQYVAQQLQGRRNTATQAADWIETRVEDLRKQVELAEAAVEDYRADSLEKNGTSADIVSQRMVSLNKELIATRVDRVAAEARYNEMARLLETGGFDALGSMFTSDTIKELDTRRVEIEATDAQWAERFDDNHPERRRIAGQLAEVNRALSVEFQRALDAQRNEVQIAQIRENTIRESLEYTEAQYLLVSRSSIGLRQLERQAEVARNMYSDLLNRYAETRTQEQLQQADARIIERATLPGAPSAPRPKLMTFLGLVIGGLLGFGVAAFRQLSTRAYRSPVDLALDTGVPVLGTTPERNWASTAAAIREIEADPMGPVAEAMKKVRNELKLGEEIVEPQSIALLSPLQDEGKTTTTVLLARVSELANKLVVVVDCDFRKNSLQNEYQLPMEHDLGELIRGDCSVLDAVNTDTGLGFDLLANRAPDPTCTDLLTTEWLRSTLDELKQYYDVILVNCPAILPVAETLVLARAVDQRVMLVRHNSTARSAARRCLSTLEHNELDIVGQIMTRVDPRMLSDEDLYRYNY